MERRKRLYIKRLQNVLRATRDYLKRPFLSFDRIVLGFDHRPSRSIATTVWTHSLSPEPQGENHAHCRCLVRGAWGRRSLGRV